MKRIASVFGLSALAACCNAQPTTALLVNAAAPSGGDGRSWQTAFRNPQEALALIATQPGQFSEIWIASGIYLPSQSADRTAAFVLPPTLTVFGGFAGNESNTAQRPPAAAPTVLSGDLAGDDVTGSWTANRADNSYLVVSIPVAGGMVTFDRVTIRSGTSGGGGSCAAIRANSTQLTLRDCTITENFSNQDTAVRTFGAAILRDCRFIHNFSWGSGGAVAAASIDAERCVFEANQSMQSGGALYTRPGGAVTLYACVVTSSNADQVAAVAAGGPLTAVNCVFAGNRASSAGVLASTQTLLRGCVVRDNLLTMASVLATGQFRSCTLVNNTCDTNGRFFVGPAFNCISWGNQGSTGWPHELDPATSTNCCIMGLTGSGNGNFGGDPHLDGEGRPQPGSSCIDAGLNSAVPTGPDIESNCRIVDGNADGVPVVDVGAFEVQTCPANCDCSTQPPLLNVLDFACFVDRYSAGDRWTNCDRSTTPPVLNVLDFNCFVNRFTSGCP